MIIVRIFGGLGNQMFQYAYARALANNGFDVKLDLSKFKTYKLHGGYQLDKYNITLNNASSLSTFLGKIGIKKNKKEESLLFDDRFKSLIGNEYIKGYFQTEKYFKEIRSILLEEFSIQQKLSNEALKYAELIKKARNSCSIHIRRGDYISDKKANSVHGTCNLDYYKKAIENINNINETNSFFVFSDDIAWSKSNLPLKNGVFVEMESIPHEDLFLMSLCNNNVIANSSFSWWGAWLNQNNNKVVIAPKNWFVKKENEVACKNWIKL